MIVYELIHTYYAYEDDFFYSLRSLGFYTDIDKAKEAQAYLVTKPGYVEAPYGFIIRQRKVIGEITDDVIYEAMMYAHTEDFEDYEYTEELGLFAEREEAFRVLQEFKGNNECFWLNNFLQIEEIDL